MPAQTAAPHFAERYRVTIVCAITAVAAGLRVFHLGAKSFWLDEGATFAIVHRDWASFCSVLWNREGNMAFYYLLMRGWVHLGTSESALRSLSAVAGIAAIPVIFLLGRQLFDGEVGLLATLLLSFQTAHVEYSQEARGYSLVVLLCILSFLFLHRAVGTSSRTAWALYVVATVLAIYSQFLTGLVVAAQVGSLVFVPRARVRWRSAAISGAIVAALCVPALIFVGTKDVGQLAWVPPLNLKQIHHAATLLTGNGLILLLYAPLLLYGTVSLVRKILQRPLSFENWNAVLLLGWLVVPLVILLGLSAVKPLFAPRFLLMCVPASVLITAYAIALLPRTWIKSVIVAALLVASAASLGTYYSQPKEDWRSVSKLVLSNRHAGDAIVLCDADAFDYYRFRLTGGRDGLVEFTAANLQRGSAEFDSLYNRVWFVAYDWRLASDPTCRAAATSLPQAYAARDRQSFGNIRVVFFSKPSQ